MFKWLKRHKSENPTNVATIASDKQLLMQRGNIAVSQDDFPTALDCYRLALALDPLDAKVRVNLGFVLIQLLHYDEALDQLTKALATDPNDADCHYLIGGLKEKILDLDNAARHFKTAFLLKPDFELACRDASRVLGMTGHIHEARDLIFAGLRLNPGFADLHFYLGNLHLADEQWDMALESYQEAIALGADYSALHGFLGGLLLRKNQIVSACSHLERAIELEPSITEAHHDLGVVYHRLGKIDKAIQQQRIALSQDPNLLHAHSCLLYALSISDAYSPDQYLIEARSFGEVASRRLRAAVKLIKSRQKIDGRQLRIGMMSGDLRWHVVARFLECVLDQLLAAPVITYAFSNNEKNDAVTHRLQRKVSHWQDVSALNDDEAEKLIKQCQLDILLDLSGHTAGNRLALFARRVAPVQVSWLGYWASTGVKTMDYFIADRVSAPLAFHKHFTEKVWCLPETRLCLSPPSDAGAFPVSSLPALTAGHLTFGCFQTLAKISDTVLQIWSQVMAAVPESRLRFQCRHLDAPSAQEDLLLRLERVGISVQRVSLYGGTSSDAYLMAHNQVDMILDTFPYPGGTTTADALWMGVPTLTMLGTSLLARQGASMLSSAGLTDWVASDVDEYIARAISHAGDLKALASLRSQLRGLVLASPLFDSARFTRHLLTALYAMSQQQRPPTLPVAKG
ncbi:MAG: tetratricopeptide repeat protein [Comamonadaceae bacterium]|nr:tetratricopeptide repeat protein [Comamonadaceae bacterium]